MDKRLNEILDELRALTETVFDGVVGIYLHGSAAFGCFAWDRSDIDLLVVLENAPTHEQKRHCIEGLIAINEHAPKKGIELSVVLLRDTLKPRHPTHYELHFSNSHIDAYRADIDGHIRRLCGNDPDLCAHFAVTEAVGITVCGRRICEVFGSVTRRDYLESIRYDIENAKSDILKDPVYVTLNLCRAVSYAEKSLILSKSDGALYIIDSLPDRFRPIVKTAYLAYTKGIIDTADTEVVPFADYMLSRFRVGMQN